MDEQTAARIRDLIGADDMAALDVIYDEIGDRLYKYLLVILGSEGSAEDVMQNLFMAIARKRQRLCRARNMTGYLFAMARNQAMDYLAAESRRGKRFEGGEAFDSILESRAAEPAEQASEDIEEAACALTSLPLPQREVVAMKCLQDMTFAGIAESLSISPNTAASRYRLGLARLRTMLGRDQGRD